MYVQREHASTVLKKRTTWVDADDMKKLAALTKKKRLKVSQLIRIAIAEYIEREST
jgi:Ribbon-helix-helix protein, copG family